ncbi:hypothetical protein CBS147339_9998 [Penicillium roqueforti]|nr:hypothetical protein DTO013F2_10499 [Penicillium roqueforti]KAI2760975.1 hypothetical protein DTO012A8_9625 [Penicillium roqueforti]KAI3061537.1 hypothetical protein CBS147339_9998 [Penicillium roqueforti]KAI3088547.1 hypothetical protein CBS147338_9964 [Penicillium roqueforti]KAI3174307.1 hypothetical protein DTO032C6_9997 [Penicillium roqueforti]
MADYHPLSAIPSRVILKDSSNWALWLTTIQAIAQTYNIWDYCNPKLEKEPDRPVAPIAPKWEDVKKEYGNDWYNVFNVLNGEYQEKKTTYNRGLQGFNVVANAIKSNVLPTHQAFLTQDSPWALLRNLRQRYAPECDPMYRSNLRVEWNNLDRGLDRNTNIEKWLLKWETLYTRCVAAEVSEAKDAAMQFLQAIITISPEFFAARLKDVQQSLSQEKTQQERTIEFSELLSHYKTQWDGTIGRQATQKGMSKAVFSTWQGHQEAQPVSTNENSGTGNSKRAKSTNDTPFFRKKCPCGSRGKYDHPAWKCWGAYPEMMPEGYNQDPEYKKAWDKAMKEDPAWKAYVDKRHEELGTAPRKNRSQQANATIQSEELGFFATEEETPDAVFQTHETMPMNKRWLVDTGAQVHVCNDRNLFVTFEETESTIKVGDTASTVTGIGKVEINGIDPVTNQTKKMTLYNAKYSPNFHTNLIAHNLMFKKTGAFLNFEKNWIEKNGTPLYKTHEEQNLSWLSQPPGFRSGFKIPQTQNDSLALATLKRSEREPESEASLETWHRRLGHIGKKRIEKLSEMTEGVMITGSNPENQVCEACQLADAPKQISRRRIGTTYGILGRVHFDLVQNQPAWNRHVWLTHFYLDGIKCHFVFTHVKKNDCQMAVRKFIALVKNWLNVRVRVFHYDNERSAGNEVESMIEAEGCVIEHSPPDLPEMNGPAERSGGVIVKMARTFINDTDLPKTMWTEAVYAAAYIANRVPTKIENQWIIPWLELMKLAAPDGIKYQKINLSNIRVYGCLAYSRIVDSKRVQSEKMAPRAEIGYLVGYVSKNLYRIWFPHKGGKNGRVDVVRDAVFDESRQYKSSEKLEFEDAISIMTDGIEAIHWPMVLTMDQAQAELGSQMQMPLSVARIALHDDAEHTQQGVDPHGNNQQIDDKDDRQNDHNGDQQRDDRERELQEEESGRQQTPIAMQKGSPDLPPTPISNKPRDRMREHMPGSFPIDIHLPTSPPLQALSSPNSSRSSNQPLFPSTSPLPRPIPSSSSSSETQRQARNTISMTPDPISVLPSIESGGEAQMGDENDHDDPISESELQLQRELEQTPMLQDEETSLSRSSLAQPEYRRPRSDGVDPANIIAGTRSRRKKEETDYETYMTLEEEEPPELIHAFSTGMNERFERKERPHKDQLPPPPRNWAELKNHAYAKEFKAAAEFEIETLRRKETFSQVPTPNTKGTQILPLKWVFTYKFDADGVLEKFKARICVRGDLQWMTTDEKRAATLAVKTARAIFALVAAFDLDMKQRDVVNAFLNSILQSEVYTRCPPGFEILNECWMLHKALYGLRMAPRLWQQEATRILVKLGLIPVPEDPCIFVMIGIIVFFYVDDIIIVNHPKYAKQAMLLDQQMKKHWELRELDASWFLNIRILRDRDQKKLWLCQDSYIESMASKYDLITSRKVDSPMSIEPLEPFDGVATPSQIHGYQAKVGSAQYATTISRPDAAKATGKAAEFLLNPGPKHIDAIDRVIQYLYQTRFWAIEYGIRRNNPTSETSTMQLAAKSVVFASDASFGDNKDRKSSEGYICKLYGGPIDWKASKQKTVTTSTTEAELLALAEAGKTVQWWRRVLHALGFEPSHTLSIVCDNQQTVDLLTKEGASMHTKLRHVDINRCWLKQEVNAGRVNVDWIPTAEMPADGLTKALPRQKQERFRELLGMSEIGHLISHESRR